MMPLDPASRRKVDLIWNTTRVCPWDCEICCVDAIQPKKIGDKIVLKSAGLAEHIPHQPGAESLRAGMADLQRRKLELDRAGKLRVSTTSRASPKAGFLRRDSLCVAETLELIRIAADRFGRDHVTLTATGAGLARCRARDARRLHRRAELHLRQRLGPGQRRIAPAAMPTAT